MFPRLSVIQVVTHAPKWERSRDKFPKETFFFFFFYRGNWPLLAHRKKIERLIWQSVARPALPWGGGDSWISDSFSSLVGVIRDGTTWPGVYRPWHVLRQQSIRRLRWRRRGVNETKSVGWRGGRGRGGRYATSQRRSFDDRNSFDQVAVNILPGHGWKLGPVSNVRSGHEITDPSSPQAATPNPNPVLFRTSLFMTLFPWLNIVPGVLHAGEKSLNRLHEPKRSPVWNDRQLRRPSRALGVRFR